MMKYLNKSRQNLTLKLIENAFDYWIRSKCKSIEFLDVKIKGTLPKIIFGNIEELNVTAHNVSFQGLKIRKVYIESNKITYRLKLFNPTKLISLNDSFHIQCNLEFNEEDINLFISSDSWSWIKSSLNKHFVKENNIEKIYLNNDSLLLSTSNPKVSNNSIISLSLRAYMGTILIYNLQGQKYIFPMDKAIEITNAEIKSGIFKLGGKALVNP